MKYLTKYLLHVADDNFVLSHRLSELCGHAPCLEEEIALSNIALDLLGQARLFYGYAGELLQKSEDELVYFRTECEFLNVTLLELPNGDYAQTMLRLYLYSQFYLLQLKVFQKSNDNQLMAIADKAYLEVLNHHTHAIRWVKIFVNGTEDSQHRMQKAVNLLTPYLSELFTAQDFEKILVDQDQIIFEHPSKEEWVQCIHQALFPIALSDWENWKCYQGKKGEHSEHLGHILAKVQHIALQYGKEAQW